MFYVPHLSTFQTIIDLLFYRQNLKYIENSPLGTYWILWDIILIGHCLILSLMKNTEHFQTYYFTRENRCVLANHLVCGALSPQG